MTVFVDTSAFLALMNSADPANARAVRLLRLLVDQGATLVTTSYVTVETSSLLHQRHGIPALRRFVDSLLDVVTVDWIDEELHLAGIAAVLAAGRRGPSLVDCVSFEVMRRRRLDTALAFDKHFSERGYSLPTIGNGSDL